MPFPLHIFKHSETLIRTLDLPSALLFTFFLFKRHNKRALCFNRLVVLSTNANNSLWLAWTLTRVIIVAGSSRIWEVAAPFSWWLDNASTINWRLAYFSYWRLPRMTWLPSYSSDYIDSWSEVIDTSHWHSHIVHLLIGACRTLHVLLLIIEVCDRLLLRILLNASEVIICIERICDPTNRFVRITHSTLQKIAIWAHSN